MRARRWVATAICPVFLMGLSAPKPAPVNLPARTHPESVSIAPDGVAYVSSPRGGVLRVDLVAGKAEPWLKPGAFGSASVFGLLVDPGRGLLWLCSNDLGAMGITVEGGEKGSYLKAFDLRTGEGRQSLRLPGDNPLCNDMALASDGTLYVTDTNRSHILRLRPGASALEDWHHDPAYAREGRDGLDGIALGADGHLYINNFLNGVLARVALNADGTPGATTVLATSRPLAMPDGLRALGGLRFAQAEGGGKIAIVTVQGDRAEIETVRDGLQSPTGLDARDGTIWYVEGALNLLFNPQLRGQTPPAFTLTPVNENTTD